MPKKLTTEEFVAKAVALHKGRYDYTLVQYAGCNERVKIICSIHGIFEQRPVTHIEGKGCVECSKVSPAKQSLKLGAAEYIRRAKQVHGDAYDYEETEYTKYQGRITIICRAHGPFMQYAHMHLQGSRCPRCAMLSRTKGKYEKGKREYIARCQAIHPQYDFSQTNYTASKEKVVVVCPTHGPFSIKASSLLSGHGCLKCARYLTMQKWVKRACGRPATLYFVRMFGGGEEFYKVGVTIESVQQRYRAKGSLGGIYQYEVLALHTSSNAAAIFDWEQSILETFTHLKYHPKVSFDGVSECFSSCDEILEVFPL